MTEAEAAVRIPTIRGTRPAAIYKKVLNEFIIKEK